MFANLIEKKCYFCLFCGLVLTFISNGRTHSTRYNCPSLFRWYVINPPLLASMWNNRIASKLLKSGGKYTKGETQVWGYCFELDLSSFVLVKIFCFLILRASAQWQFLVLCCLPLQYIVTLLEMMGLLHFVTNVPTSEYMM